MNQTDLKFLKHFAMVIAGLMALTLVLILGALAIHQRQPSEANPKQQQAIDQRIAPVAAVYSGETGKAAIETAKASALAAAGAQVAYEGSTDGGLIYEKLCSACHGSGVAGAPKLTKADWASRQAQGIDVLVSHALDGYQGATGIMPARGGNPALSDDQIKATVRWMLENLDQ